MQRHTPDPQRGAKVDGRLDSLASLLYQLELLEGDPHHWMHQLIGSLSHYLQVFFYIPGGFGISSIHSIIVFLVSCSELYYKMLHLGYQTRKWYDNKIATYRNTWRMRKPAPFAYSQVSMTTLYGASLCVLSMLADGDWADYCHHRLLNCLWSNQTCYTAVALWTVSSKTLSAG